MNEHLLIARLVDQLRIRLQRQLASGQADPSEQDSFDDIDFLDIC